MGVEGLGLREAIESVRSELLAAQASNAGDGLYLPVNSVTVELQLIATKNVGGKAGFKVPIVDLELGGSAGQVWENASTITLVFGPPEDATGSTIKVAKESSQQYD